MQSAYSKEEEEEELVNPTPVRTHSPVRQSIISAERTTRGEASGALRNLEHAVRRYGQSVRLFTTWRQHTSRKRHVPEETLTQFKHLITFQPGGKSFQLTPAFQQALLDAENRIAQYHASLTADRTQQGRHQAGTRRPGY